MTQPNVTPAAESTIIDGIESPPAGYGTRRAEIAARDLIIADYEDMRGGDPCPRCGRPMASCSPSGRETAACDHCQTVYGDD